MTDAAEGIFKNKRPVFDKLLSYGFRLEGGLYEFESVLAGSKLILKVLVSKEGAVSARIIDPEFGEEYRLHLSAGAAGAFVGEVRREYEEALADICASCFEPFVFKSAQAARCMDFALKTYGSRLEFLWERFPDNAVWRRDDNRKWYGVLLTVRARKLGFDRDGTLEVIDLRMEKSERQSLIDGDKYLLGYHMNKSTWFSVILDGRVDDAELFQRIASSFDLAGRK